MLLHGTNGCLSQSKYKKKKNCDKKSYEMLFERLAQSKGKQTQLCLGPFTVIGYPGPNP